MDHREDDEGDACDWEASAAALTRAPEPPADDYQRHLRAEGRWQARRAAARLWEHVKRWIALGR